MESDVILSDIVNSSIVAPSEESGAAPTIDLELLWKNVLGIPLNAKIRCSADNPPIPYYGLGPLHILTLLTRQFPGVNDLISAKVSRVLLLNKTNNSDCYADSLTPLDMAVRYSLEYSEMETVRILATQMFSTFDIPITIGESALIVAAQFRGRTSHPGAVFELLKFGLKANPQMIYAIINGTPNVECIDIIRACMSVPSATSAILPMYDWESLSNHLVHICMHVECCEHRLAIGRFLISEYLMSGDIKSHDLQLVRFLSHACVNGINQDMIELIVELYPRVLECTGSGYLHNLWRCADYTAAVTIGRFLIKSGTNVNATVSRSRTPLHEISRTNNIELAALLLEAGADLFARDDRGHIALHFATFEGARNMVQFLMSRGLQPDYMAYDNTDSFYQLAAGSHLNDDRFARDYMGIFHDFIVAGVRPMNRGHGWISDPLIAALTCNCNDKCSTFNCNLGIIRMLVDYWHSPDWRRIIDYAVAKCDNVSMIRAVHMIVNAVIDDVRRGQNPEL